MKKSKHQNPIKWPLTISQTKMNHHKMKKTARKLNFIVFFILHIELNFMIFSDFSFFADKILKIKIIDNVLSVEEWVDQIKE